MSLKTHMITFFTIFVTLASLIITGSGYADHTLTMASFVPQETGAGKWISLIFTDAFKRLGLELEYRFYPARRASYAANEGQVDGEFMRPYDYATEYPNLIRVDETAVIDSVSAYVADPNIQLNGWESLKDTDYRVDYVRGSTLTETHLQKVVAPEKLSVINDWSFGFERLVNNRTEVFVAPDNVIMLLFSQEELEQRGIRNAGMMTEVPLYPYLHKRHADLAPKLAAALQALKEEGLIEHYLTTAREQIRNQ